VVAPWTVLALIALAFSAGPLMGTIAGIKPSRDDVARGHFYRQWLADLRRVLLSGAWLVGQLLQLALMAIDAIVRALWRTFVSRRRLLEWTTAAAAQASATTELPTLARKHWGVVLAGLGLGGALWALGSPHPVFATLLCAAWTLSPVWTWWVSRPRPTRRVDALSGADRDYLLGVARDTWRLFERCVVPEDHHLPPDNLQIAPHDIVAHRTSPTNIGLYLLATMCAREYGWIGRRDALDRLEATLGGLQALPRHRGHFLNWYDTSQAQALLPQYVSTVDSGNLCVHLLAVAQACLELQGAPSTTRPCAASSPAPRRASTRCARRPRGRRPRASSRSCSMPPTRSPSSGPIPPRRRDASTRRSPSCAACRHRRRRAPAAKRSAVSAGRSRTGWRPCARRCATARAATTRRRASPPSPRPASGWRRSRTSPSSTTASAVSSTSAFASPSTSSTPASTTCSRRRRARPACGRSPRATCRPTHWAALGRPLFACGDLAGLRSWSGSMFEYLMPTLVLDEPHGSLLHAASRAAVEEQIAFARRRHVPWGISESAYAGSDHTLAYQYAPQGVPGLALRRTPLDELVVAPYATALAAQVAPHRAVANLRRLEAARARGRYGFIEALDYTPARQSGTKARPGSRPSWRTTRA
jgi:cyclic beta-1,2-glucan synthetase